ncbi:MAG: FtsX-like permease family protein [Chloroflexi bacterium]|nr:FtsX-like permease family protein [Chloroflexota bacterium]
MFRTHARKIYRDILARKRRTLLIAASIFVGVAGTITLFSMGDILIGQLHEDFRNEDVAMLTVDVRLEPGTPADHQATIDWLATIIGVTEVRGNLRASVYHQTQDKATPATIMAYSEPFAEMTLEPVRLVSGNYPVAGEQEIAVEMRFAEAHAVEMGDNLRLRVSGTPIWEEWRISGIIFHPYVLEPENFIYAQLPDANYLSGTYGYNSFSARFDSYLRAENSAHHFAAVILHDTPYDPLRFQLQDPTYNPLTEGTERISRTLNYLAVIALVMSGFSVINVISAIITEQKRQIGLMKALGATRIDNLLIYVGIAFTYGGLGVIPGLLVGVPAGYFLAEALAPQANTVLTGFRLSLRGMGVGIGLGLLVPIAASIVPVLHGAQVRIADAMSDRGIDKHFHYGPIGNLLRVLPIPIWLRQGLNNINIKKLRVGFTMITLAVAVGAFMGIFAVFDALSNKKDDVIAEIRAEHTGISQTAIVSPPRQQVDLGDSPPPLVPNEYLTTVSIDGYDGEVYAIGLDETFSNVVTLDAGRFITPEKPGVIVTATIAQERGLQVGKEIILQSDQDRRAYPIVGIFTPPAQFNGQPIPRYVVGMFWRDLAALEGRTVEVTPTGETVSESLSAGTFNFVTLLETFSGNLRTYQALLSAISLLIAIVGGLSLLATLSLSVLERQREIGIMRCVGARSRTIALQFLIEGMAVGLFAWVIGLPIASVIADQLLDATGLDARFTATIRLDVAALGLAGVMLITLVASIWPARIAARQTVAQTLRYQ